MLLKKCFKYNQYQVEWLINEDIIDLYTILKLL